MDKRTEEGEIVGTVGGKKSERSMERRVGRSKEDDTRKPYRYVKGRKLPDELQRILDRYKERMDGESMRKVHESKKRQKKKSSVCGFPIPTDSFGTAGGKKSKRRVGRSTGTVGGNKSERKVGRNKEDDTRKPYRYVKGRKLPDELQRILARYKEKMDKKIGESMRKVHESKKRQKKKSSVCGFPIPTTDFFRSYRFN